MGRDAGGVARMAVEDRRLDGDDVPAQGLAQFIEYGSHRDLSVGRTGPDRLAGPGLSGHH